MQFARLDSGAAGAQRRPRPDVDSCTARGGRLIDGVDYQRDTKVANDQVP